VPVPRPLVYGFTPAAVALALAGCTFVVQFVSQDAPLACDGAPCGEVDAGSPPAALDAAPCCGCIDDPLNAASAARFRTIGTAHLLPEYAELTTQQQANGVAGGVFWNRPVSLKNFDVSFEVSVSSAANSAADGVAFVFLGVAPGDLTACRGAGSTLCILGAVSEGFGLVLRTYASRLEPTPPYLALIRVDEDMAADGGPPILGDGEVRILDGLPIVARLEKTGDPVPDASWHTITLHVEEGVATATIDHESPLSNVRVAVPSDGGVWGFVGSTGYYSEYAAVRNVHLVDRTALCDGG
jgi:hypothetical protein